VARSQTFRINFLEASFTRAWNFWIADSANGHHRRVNGEAERSSASLA
jgi:hypothetical protein